MAQAVAGDALKGRAAAHLATGALQEAIQDYGIYLDANPTDATALTNRGAALAQIGQQQRALQDFTLAIRSDPSRADAYYQRGKLLTTRGDLQAAMADYQQAAKLFCPGKISDVPDMKQIEAAIGKNDLQAVLTAFGNLACQFVAIKYDVRIQGHRESKLTI